jgi:glutathione S-transferase
VTGLTLFYAPGSCSQASHIALEDSGLAYDVQRVDFKANEQRSDAYLKLNPKGRVPLLVTPQGPISENVAILAFIAQSAPEKHLAPADLVSFAQAQAFNAYLSSTVHVAHAHRLRGYRWTDDVGAQEALKKKVAQNMTDYFTLIENEYFKGPWVMGGQYTICDPYLYVISTWLEGDGVDAKQFPKVHEHRSRMAERPAVKKVLAREAA